MKTKILALMLLISFNGISQTYQKGYYIDNNNNKIEGFIKNYDWKNNPTSFEFKRSLDLNNETIDIAFSKEFGVYGKVVYLKSQVEIERSSEKIANIGYNKNPVFNSETLFLKLMVSGKNKLYYYYNEGIEKFFYSSENNPIKQLIFIKYKISLDDVKYKEEYKNYEANSVLYNETYKKQLWLEVRCPETLASEPSNVAYTGSDLTKYFAKINNCNGSTEKIEYEVKKTIFSLKAVALMNMSKIAFRTSTVNGSFDKSNSFAAGVDLEFLFPFNDYKWSLFIEPSYNSYQGDTNLAYGLNNSLNQTVKLKMNYIQIPIGLRYYLNINNDSKIFLGAGFNATSISDGVIDFEHSRDLEFAGFTYNFLFSAGYKYKRISTELRWYTTTNLSSSSADNIDFSRLSLALKYEIFKK